MTPIDSVAIYPRDGLAWARRSASSYTTPHGPPWPQIATGDYYSKQAELLDAARIVRAGGRGPELMERLGVSRSVARRLVRRLTNGGGLYRITERPGRWEET